jgi:hypothetical protein
METELNKRERVCALDFLIFSLFVYFVLCGVQFVYLRKITVNYEIRPENEKRPTTRSRGIHFARQAAKRPEVENGPRPAPRARPPCGPRRKPTHWPARAQRVPRSKPQPGPGPGKSLPTWAETRSGDREPSISIQRLRKVSGRTKPRRQSSCKP